MRTKYAIQIFWSEEDQGFIGTCNSFIGLSAFGETREDALRETQIALDAIVETYRESGVALPEPQGVLLAA